MNDLGKTRTVIYQLLGAIPTIKATTKSRWADNLATPVFVVTMFFLFLGTIFYLISGYRNVFPNGIFPNWGKSPFAPKTLTYERLWSEKNDDGLYESLFEVFVYNPPGNTNPTALLTFQLGQDAECEYGSKTGFTEIAPGVSSTTQRTLIECLTREPIIDNGALFGIIEQHE